MRSWMECEDMEERQLCQFNEGGWQHTVEKSIVLFRHSKQEKSPLKIPVPQFLFLSDGKEFP